MLVPPVQVGEIGVSAGEQPEGEVDPHEDISQVAKFLQGQEAGSHRSKELHADVREAEVLWNWLASSHLDWLDAQGVSRIVCASTRKDQSILFFARKGRSFCAKARRAVICYERFVAANASRINCGGSPYPATAELVTWCVLWTIDVSRERQARAAAKGGVAALRNFKGTSGNAQLKGLGMAYRLFIASQGRCTINGPSWG